MNRRRCCCGEPPLVLEACCAGDGIYWAVAVFEETTVTNVTLSGLGEFNNYSFEQTGASTYLGSGCVWRIPGDLDDGSTVTAAIAIVSLTTNAVAQTSRFGVSIATIFPNGSVQSADIAYPNTLQGNISLSSVGGGSGSFTVNPLGLCIFCCGDCRFDVDTINNLTLYQELTGRTYSQTGPSTGGSGQCNFIIPMETGGIPNLTGTVSLTRDTVDDTWDWSYNLGSGPSTTYTTAPVGAGSCNYSVSDTIDNGGFDVVLDFDVVAESCTEVIPFEDSIGARRLNRIVRGSDMAMRLREAVPDAFKTGCSGCSDVLRLLNCYSRERAVAKIDLLTDQFYRATQMPDRPSHVAAMTWDDCKKLLERIIDG